jgi:hypothetical protein
MSSEQPQDWWALNLLMLHNHSGFRKLGDALTEADANRLMGEDDLLLARGSMVDEVTQILASEDAPFKVYLFEAEGVDEGEYCQLSGRWQLTAIGDTSMTENQLVAQRMKHRKFEESALVCLYDGETARRIFKKITTQ